MDRIRPRWLVAMLCSRLPREDTPKHLQTGLDFTQRCSRHGSMQDLYWIIRASEACRKATCLDVVMARFPLRQSSRAACRDQRGLWSIHRLLHDHEWSARQAEACLRDRFPGSDCGELFGRGVERGPCRA